MVNKVLFWTGFGIACRFWQMGIEMRPFHSMWWAYGIYGGLGASFGYWLQGVEERQMRYLRETRDRLLEKRQRRAEREGISLDPFAKNAERRGVVGVDETSGGQGRVQAA